MREVSIIGVGQTPVGEQQALQHESVTSARPLLLLAGIVVALAIAVALAWLLLEFGT